MVAVVAVVEAGTEVEAKTEVEIEVNPFVHSEMTRRH